MENIPKVIEETLNVLSAKFGTTGELLWESIMKQQLIDGILNLFFCVLSVAVAIFVSMITMTDEQDLWGLWLVVGLAVLFFCITLSMSVSLLANPTKSALDDVMSYFKKLE
jgi:hypothetical protein